MSAPYFSRSLQAFLHNPKNPRIVKLGEISYPEKRGGFWNTLAPLDRDSPLYRESYIDPEPKEKKTRRVSVALPTPTLPALLLIPFAAGFAVLVGGLALAWVLMLLRSTLIF